MTDAAPLAQMRPVAVLVDGDPHAILLVYAVDREAASHVDAELWRDIGLPALPERIDAALRQLVTDRREHATRFVSDGVTIDPFRRVAQRGKARIRFSNIEWSIIQALADHANEPVSHEALLRAVWNTELDASTHRRLRVHLTHIRRKLERQPNRPSILLTEPGYGYRLVARRKK